MHWKFTFSSNWAIHSNLSLADIAKKLPFKYKFKILSLNIHKNVQKNNFYRHSLVNSAELHGKALFLIILTIFLHTWYLSQLSQIRYVEKNLSCGEISNLYAWQMWRNLKFLHMWSNFKFLHIVEMWRNLTFLHMLSNFKFLHMTDVEKSEVSPHLACVWCGECI